MIDFLLLNLTVDQIKWLNQYSIFFKRFSNQIRILKKINKPWKTFEFTLAIELIGLVGRFIRAEWLINIDGVWPLDVPSRPRLQLSASPSHLTDDQHAPAGCIDFVLVLIGRQLIGNNYFTPETWSCDHCERYTLEP